MGVVGLMGQINDLVDLKSIHWMNQNLLLKNLSSIRDLEIRNRFLWFHYKKNKFILDFISGSEEIKGKSIQKNSKKKSFDRVKSKISKRDLASI